MPEQVRPPTTASEKRLVAVLRSQKNVKEIKPMLDGSPWDRFSFSHRGVGAVSPYLLFPSGMHASYLVSSLSYHTVCCHISTKLSVRVPNLTTHYEINLPHQLFCACLRRFRKRNATGTSLVHCCVLVRLENRRLRYQLDAVVHTRRIDQIS